MPVNNKKDTLDASYMKPRTMAAIATAVTALLMIATVACVIGYTKEPENAMWMAGMGLLSSGMMIFLLLFALVYGRPTDAERYEQIQKRRRE